MIVNISSLEPICEVFKEDVEYAPECMVTIFIIYCYIINYPKTYLLKTTKFIIS